MKCHEPFGNVHKCSAKFCLLSTVFRYLMKYTGEVDHLIELLISEVYFLWCLAGGDLKRELNNLQYNSGPMYRMSR